MNRGVSRGFETLPFRELTLAVFMALTTVTFLLQFTRCRWKMRGQEPHYPDRIVPVLTLRADCSLCTSKPAHLSPYLPQTHKAVLIIRGCFSKTHSSATPFLHLLATYLDKWLADHHLLHEPRPPTTRDVGGRTSHPTTPGSSTPLKYDVLTDV
jgi:hypothetical protein